MWEHLGEMLAGFLGSIWDSSPDTAGSGSQNANSRKKKIILISIIIITVLALIAVGIFVIKNAILLTGGIGVLVFLSGLFVFIKIYRQKQSELRVGNAELEETKKELEEIKAELTKKAEILKTRDAELDEKDQEIEGWKKIFDSDNPKEMGFYLRNKKYFDSFKTELILSDCKLDARLVRAQKIGKKKRTKKKLQFEWTLTVLRPPSYSGNVARFIFSDDDGGHQVSPKVTVNGQTVRPMRKAEDDVKGSYCFIEIPLGNGFSRESTATIQISYTFSVFEFDQKRDVIWLAPGTLGFEDVEKFRIRFFCDGEIIKDTTYVQLVSYTLKGGYREMGRTNIECERFNKNEQGFQCEKQKSYEPDLKKFAYMLVLKNGEKSENLVNT